MSEAANVVRLADVSNDSRHWGAWDAIDTVVAAVRESDRTLGPNSVRAMVVTYVDWAGAVHTYRVGADPDVTLLAQLAAQSELDSFAFGGGRAPSPPVTPDRAA